MSELVWLCAEHYQLLCKAVGYEVPVMTIYNSFYSKCADCDELGEHFVDRQVAA